MSESQAVGLGVYILATVWLVSLLLCIVSVRTGQYIGAVALTLSFLLTLGLLLIPRVSNQEATETEHDKVYDSLFVMRYASLALIVASGVGGIACYVACFCTTPVHTKKLRHWKQ